MTCPACNGTGWVVVHVAEDGAQADTCVDCLNGVPADE